MCWDVTWTLQLEVIRFKITYQQTCAQFMFEQKACAAASSASKKGLGVTLLTLWLLVARFVDVIPTGITLPNTATNSQKVNSRSTHSHLQSNKGQSGAGLFCHMHKKVLVHKSMYITKYHRTFGHISK